jgi:hypothetical protein
MSDSIGYDSCGYPVKIPDDVKQHQETMQEMANQLRALQTEREQKEDEHIRKIAREEFERWEKQLEQRLRMNTGAAL